MVQTLEKSIEQDLMTDEKNKLAFDHLFSGITICLKKKKIK